MIVLEHFHPCLIILEYGSAGIAPAIYPVRAVHMLEPGGSMPEFFDQ